jgi:large subunit ribosomal protein L9
MVQVILLERVEKLGQMGQVVDVRPGYARNFLLPQKKALRATKDNLAYFETQRSQLEAQNLARKSEAEQVAQKLDGLSVIVIRQAGESGQLYGSVTARDVAEGITEAGFTVGRSQIVLERAIKTLGLHKQRVVLHPEVSVTVTVNVAQSAEEAEMQAKGVDPLKLAQEAAAREASEPTAAAQPNADDESVEEVPVKD